MDGKILRGLKVLELGQMLAGPYAGSIFSDLGADVVKVERPEGDDCRRMGHAYLNNDSLSFQIFNRGKRSVVLDFGNTVELDAFHVLAAEADIVLNNLRPGVSEKFGVDAQSMCARYPALIYCQISAFGQSGPMRMEPGFEPLVQAFSGLSSTNGGPDDPPTRVGSSICDQGTGMWAVIGALSLLAQRARTGIGGIVQLSLLETALAWNAQKADSWVNEGMIPPRHRSGHPLLCPYEAFDAQDKPLLVCCGNDRLFARFAEVLGRPDWIANPSYQTNRMRLTHKDALLAEVRPILASMPRDTWLARLKQAGVPCCEIHAVAEAVEHEQVKALGLMQEVADTGMVLTGLPMSINGQRPSLDKAAPALQRQVNEAAW